MKLAILLMALFAAPVCAYSTTLQEQTENMPADLRKALFFIEFDHRLKAEAFRDELIKQGYDVKLIEGDKIWRITATKMLTVDDYFAERDPMRRLTAKAGGKLVGNEVQLGGN